MMTFWITALEKKALRELSKQAGMSMSSFLTRPMAEHLAKNQISQTLIEAKSPPTSTKVKRIKMPVEPKYLRPAEAAARISVTPAFLYKVIAQGALKSHTLGKVRLIKVADLDQLVEGDTQED